MVDPTGGGLDGAATCLLAVGCADPFETEPAVRVRCLWAVEQLRAIGARPERDLQPLAGDLVGATIRAALTALTALTALPTGLTEQPAVAEAITAAGAALEILG
jgi:hypothetical protein